MAQVIRLPGGSHAVQISCNSSSSSRRNGRFNAPGSVPLTSRFLGSKLHNGSISAGISVRPLPLRITASAVTAEKPSKVPEIVLEPIKEISGIVKLPGSKSLSNRILLLAALSEVTQAIA